MPTLTLIKTFSGAGVNSASQNVSRTADGGGGNEVTITKGDAGTLTTRTDNETGSITMSDAGHSVTTGQVVDLYWSGGSRHGVTVGTVSGTTVPIGADDSGTGDALPSAATALVVSPRIELNASIDGDNVAALGFKFGFTSTTETSVGRASFQDSGDNEIAGYDLQANGVRTFDITGGETNDFTGNPITHVVVSNASTSNDATFSLGWVQDSTP